jgi:hypothetical protein
MINVEQKTVILEAKLACCAHVAKAALKLGPAHLQTLAHEFLGRTGSRDGSHNLS